MKAFLLFVDDNCDETNNNTNAVLVFYRLTTIKSSRNRRGFLGKNLVLRRPKEIESKFLAKYIICLLYLHTRMQKYRRQTVII